jgi:transcriptional regulator with XRE-family HTH domain
MASSMAPLDRTAKRLARLRRAQGLTQQQLAAKAGLSREFLNRLEHARLDPSLTTLVKLAKALRVKVTELVK